MMTKGILTTPAAIAAGVVIGIAALFAAGWKAREIVAPAVAGANASAAVDVALLRQDIQLLSAKIDTLNQRLSHLEGVWDARKSRAKPQ